MKLLSAITAVQTASAFSTTQEAFSFYINNTEIGNHGCHCRGLGGNLKFDATVPLDPRDRACKNWNQARNCLYLPNGPCQNSGRTSYDENSSCEALTDNCEKELCNIDTKYSELVSSFTDELVDVGNNAGPRPKCIDAEKQPGERKCCGIQGNFEIYKAETHFCNNNYEVEIIKICDPGQGWAQDSQSCEACAEDFFSASTDSEPCVPCPNGWHSETGSNSCFECENGTSWDATTRSCGCEPGQGWNEDTSTCDACAMDHYSGETNLEPCTPCMNDFYSPPSATSCFQCNSGKVWNATTRACGCSSGQEWNEAASVCTDCAAGLYSDSIDLQPCKSCTTTDEYGYEIVKYSLPGSSSCIECGDEQVWRAETGYCRDKCRPGQEYNTTLNQCVDCPINEYSNEETNFQCESCLGFGRNGGVNENPTITYSYHGWNVTYQYRNYYSIPEKYKGFDIEMHSTLFQEDNYPAQSGQSSCRSCESLVANSYRRQYVWNAATKSCTKACRGGEGWKEGIIGNDCVDCPANFFGSRGFCYPCPENSYSNPGAIDDIRECDFCEDMVGSVWFDKAEYGLGICTCPVNTYSDNWGSACLSCPDGKNSPINSQSIDDCVACPNGTSWTLSADKQSGSCI